MTADRSVARWWAWTACIVLALAASAQAQVFRCTVDGRTVFADQPCGERSQPVAGLPVPAPPSDLRFDVHTRHYAVPGHSYFNAIAWMRANNPGGFAGWARWRVHYRHETRPAGNACEVAAVRIGVDGDILMPQWTGLAEASPTDRERWQRMYDLLMVHEQGHIQHGREFAVLLRQRLLGLGRMPCAEVETRLRQEYELLMSNLRHRDAEYDRRTEHGLRQNNPR